MEIKRTETLRLTPEFLERIHNRRFLRRYWQFVPESQCFLIHVRQREDERRRKEAGKECERVVVVEQAQTKPVGVIDVSAKLRAE